MFKSSEVLSNKNNYRILPNSKQMWALRKILRIPYSHHVMNVELRATTGCHPLSHLVTDRRLRLCGQLDILPTPHHKRTTTVLSLW